jgi:nucleotide-binding universal stress UspA family protein
MYKHIMIPTDGSELSEMAIRQGVAFAKSLKAKVTGIAVFPTFHTFAVSPMMVTDTPEQFRRDCEAFAAKYLDVVTQEAKTAGVPCKVIQAVNDDPYRAIIDAAKTEGCDLIFMASHGRRGMSALVLGSETTKVLSHTKIPVLVCR